MKILQQIGLLTAGAQPWHVDICSGNGKYFVFSATLAVYIHEFDEEHQLFRLHSVMCESEKTISSIKWCENSELLFAVTTTDNTVIVWDIKKQCTINKLQLNFDLVAMEWFPYERNTISFLSGAGKLFLWKYLTDQAYNLFMEPIQGYFRKHLIFKWNKKILNKLCFGNLDGSISVVTSGKSHVKEVFSTLDGFKDREGKDRQDCVTDLQWDPLSTDYVLVATESGTLRLIDTERQIIVMGYKLPKGETNIRKLCWVTNAPGMFLSGDSNTGTLRLWSVSSESPILHFKVKDTGFNSLHSISTSRTVQSEDVSKSQYDSFSISSSSNKYEVPPVKIVSVFKDGGVGLYDLKKKSWDFLREKGHVETIFKCEFFPENPDILATASFDGTMKVWNITNMTLKHESPGNLSIIYCISWAPANLNCIAAATSKFGVVIWNIEKNQITHRFCEHGDKNVFHCSWNKKDPRYLASTGADKYCIVRKLDGIVVKRYEHPANVYGCDWNPKNKEIIATGCDDAQLRVWYLASDKKTPLKVFKGHTGKVFGVKWSPYKDGLIATSSDDRTVRIWDYSEDSCLQCLEGHTAPVRGLQWNPELPNLLMSGSWDHKIKLWNVRTGYCIDTCDDHAADIYDFACHSQRPFLVASSSRDSTLRLWRLDCFLQPIYLKLLAKIDISGQDANALDLIEVNQMCGNMMNVLSMKRNEPWRNQLHFFSHVFLHPEGIQNLWLLVSIIKNGKAVVLPDNYEDSIMHSSHLRGFTESKANELETARANFKIMGPMKRQEKLAEAAEIYLSLGQLEKYCEIMIELNKWEKAISVSPGVSMKYWRELVTRYTRVLELRDDDDLVTYSSTIKDTSKTCEFYAKRQQHETAVITSKMALETELQPFNLHDQLVNGDCASEIEPDRKEELRRLHDECSERLAEWYFQKGKSCLSACCHLARNDIEGAIWKLVRGNELELAYSLTQCFDIEETLLKEVIGQLCRRCERYGLQEEVIAFLKPIKNNSDDLLLSCVRSCKTDSERNVFLKKASMESIEDYKMKGSLNICDDKERDGMIFQLLMGHYEKLVQRILCHCKDVISNKSWKVDDVFHYMEILGSVPKEFIQKCEKTLQTEILALSAYIGALKAIQLKLYAVVVSLFQHASSLLKEQHVDIGVKLSQLQAECEAWLVNRIHGRSKDHTAFTQVPTDNQRDIHKKLLTKCESPVPHRYTGEYQVAGQRFPSHCVKHTDYLTKQKIMGTVWILEDGKSALSKSTALMWARVNSFSPLATGDKINPF